MLPSRIAAAFPVLLSTLLVGCGGGTPANPSPNLPLDSTSPVCRTYTTVGARSFAMSAGLTGVIAEACSYSTNTNEHRCTLNYTDSNGLSYTTVVTHRYASVADFVDEVRVIPPIARLTAGTVTYSPSGAGMQNRTETYSYDTQRRLTQIVFRFDGGAVQTATYSTWDASGRPTAASIAGTNLTYAYNDAQRTMTITTPATGAVQTHTYDGNGNQVQQVVSAGSSTETWTWTIAATERICQ